MGKKTTRICLALLGAPALLVALLLAGLAGYLPSEAAVTREFGRRHPGWQVTDVTRRGGDEDGCYYEVGYRMPPGAGRREAHWVIMCSGQFFGWKLVYEDLDVSDSNPGETK
jgi:hypothetical protein